MSLTASNSVITLSVSGIFSAPQQLKGFSADDILGTENIVPAETLMGVDGVLSGGFVNVPTKQNYTLQADSQSNSFFDTLYGQQKAAQDVFPISGLISMPALGYKWIMVKGFLTGYMPMPDLKKLAQPRKFEITWESSLPALI